MSAPRTSTTAGARVLIVLSTGQGWSQGILRGFMSSAHERGWELLHYHPGTDLDWLVTEWAPAVAVLGPELRLAALSRVPACPIVSVNADRSAEGIASVCLDEAAIGELAARHLLERGIRNLSCFRFEDSPFARLREQAFVAQGRAAGVRLAPGWWLDAAEPSRDYEDPVALTAWVRGLPRPCGVFTCTDAWGRVVARYARAAQLRVPEDLALIGVDNDSVECELIVPPLSSVAVPWRSVGAGAAALVQRALTGKLVGGERVVISPLEVVPRRSSDVFAVADPLVASAVAWIRAHAERPLSVPMVARAVGSSRQRLERHFRAVLARTVQQEIRRVRVELAKRMLATTSADLTEIAAQSGFSSAALLSVAFQRELGMPPGVYRRRSRQLASDTDAN